MATVNSRDMPKKWQRETRGGRTLEYALRVIQQPERARACGSGAKSSADRRPVDPPPVVELRIFEVDGSQEGKDITFSYEANFFLFATLEIARPTAQPRGQPQLPSQQVPVLTGMPVSGMAYLDRPTEAGYFIFPDLSVRHEGKYRLSFNLYEETKLMNDTDKEVSMESKKSVGGASPDASFDWRMEVKSEMFTVYSAKKFPGLAESTILSRTVAEQGCRVRIRRDVRMRRREGKGNGDFDEVPEDDGYRGRPAEPEFSRERTRSNSGGSDQGRMPYQDPQNQQYANSRYTPSPVDGHAAPPGHGHYLDSIGNHPGQYATPQFAQPAPPAPPAYPQRNTAPSYNPGPPGPPSYSVQHAPPPSTYYQHDRQYPQSAFPSHPPREQRDAFEPDRRASVAGYSSAASQHGQYPPTVDTPYARPVYPSYAPPMSDSMSGAPRLPPLKIASMDSKYESLSSPSVPLTSIRSIAPPLASPVHERAPEHPTFFNQYTAPQPTPEPIRNGGKRPFNNAFNSSSMSEPLHNGMRPSSSHEMDDEEMEPVPPMEYRRADGSAIRRDLPRGA